MSQANAIPWGRILAESLAIILSILLAFAIDAWWTGQQASERERLVLEGLRTDFVETQAQLTDIHQQYEGVLVAANALLDLTGPVPGSLAPSRVDTLLAEASAFPLRVVELLSSLEFENQVNERLWEARRFLWEIERRQEDTEVVLSLLIEELASF